MRILSDRPIEDDEAEEILRNWPAMVARGEAERRGSVLMLISPPMSEEEWERTYCGALAT